MPILPLFLLQRQHNYSYYLCKFRCCCLASSESSSYYLTSASCKLSFLSLSSRQLKSICFASHSLESESRRTLYATPNWPRPAAAAAIPAATVMAAATEKAPTAVFLLLEDRNYFAAAAGALEDGLPSEQLQLCEMSAAAAAGIAPAANAPMDATK